MAGSRGRGRGRGRVTVRWSGQLSVKDDFLVARSTGNESKAGVGGFSGLYGGKGSTGRLWAVLMSNLFLSNPLVIKPFYK